MGEVTRAEKRNAWMAGVAAYVIAILILAGGKTAFGHGTLLYWLAAAVAIVFLVIAAINIIPVMLLGVLEHLPKKPPMVSGLAIDESVKQIELAAEHYEWTDEELADDMMLIAKKVRSSFQRRDEAE